MRSRSARRHQHGFDITQREDDALVLPYPKQAARRGLSPLCRYAGKAPTERRSGLSRLRGKFGNKAKKMAMDECRSLYKGTKIYGDSVEALLD